MAKQTIEITCHCREDNGLAHVQDDLGDGLEEENYTRVDTAELEKNGLIPHPDKIAEAAALSSVALPKIDYKLALPAHVLFSTFPTHRCLDHSPGCSPSKPLPLVNSACGEDLQSFTRSQRAAKTTD